MTKFLAVVKREYFYRVRSKMFVVMTIIGPVMLVVFTIVPGLLFNIKTAATRLAIVDLTEGRKMSKPVRDALLQQDNEEGAAEYSKGVMSSVNENAKKRLEKAGKNLRGSFSVEDVDVNGRSLSDLKRELNARISREELDAYLVLPSDLLKDSKSKPTYYGRNVGDVITTEQIEDRLNRAVTRQRFIENGVKEQYLDELSRSVDLETHPVNGKGEEGVKD